MKKNSNSRDKILQCALKLFGERGYDSVGINEITQQAGITKPTLYYFFQSKEGVFKAILEENYEQFNQMLQKVCEYEPKVENYEEDIFSIITKIVELYFSYAKCNTTFYLMLLSLSFAPPTAQTTIITQPYIERQYKIIINLFRKIANCHSSLEKKEVECACHLVAMINANIGFWYQGKGNIDKKKAERIVHQFMHGIFT